MTEPIYYFSFQEKTVFAPLRVIYPECFFLREDHPRTNALQCFYTECPANMNCAEILAKRVWYLFDNVFPKAEMLVLYFKNNNGSICAGIFTRKMDEPNVIVCNRSAFAKFQKEGIVGSWVPTNDFFMIRSVTKLIAPEDLIGKR